MTLKSVGRKRFAHLAENLEEIHVDSNVPWGVGGVELRNRWGFK